MTDTTSRDVASAAGEQAGYVAQDAKDAGVRVAGTAKDETLRVAGEAKGQASQLLHQATGELRTQASTQQQRVAGGLRTAGEQLHSMANGSEQQGIAVDVVHQVAGRVDSVAQWLESRDPADLLTEVKSFARRRPGLFIAIAAGAGILTGRLVKAVVDSSKQQDSGATADYNATGYGTADAASGDFASPAATYPPVYSEEPVSTYTRTAPDVADSPIYAETLSDQGGELPR